MVSMDKQFWSPGTVQDLTGRERPELACGLLVPPAEHYEHRASVNIDSVRDPIRSRGANGIEKSLPGD